MGKLSGEATQPFIFHSLSKWGGGRCLKERICSPRSKFFSFKSRPPLEGFSFSVLQVVPLCKKWKDMEVYLYT